MKTLKIAKALNWFIAVFWLITVLTTTGMIETIPSNDGAILTYSAVTAMVYIGILWTNSFEFKYIAGLVIAELGLILINILRDTGDTAAAIAAVILIGSLAFLRFASLRV